MTRRYVTERRKQHRELAALDRRNRCAECKVDLAEAGQIIEDFLIVGKFCSDVCLEQYRARTDS